MVLILDGYVPYNMKDDKKIFSPIAMGGDQMTVARSRTAQQVRISSPAEHALRGFTFFAGDWHAKVNYLQVHYVIHGVEIHFSVIHIDYLDETLQH